MPGNISVGNDDGIRIRVPADRDRAGRLKV